MSDNRESLRVLATVVQARFHAEIKTLSEVRFGQHWDSVLLGFLDCLGGFLPTSKQAAWLPVAT